jgi:hypothetical protein
VTWLVATYGGNNVHKNLNRCVRTGVVTGCDCDSHRIGQGVWERCVGVEVHGMFCRNGRQGLRVGSEGAVTEIGGGVDEDVWVVVCGSPRKGGTVSVIGSVVGRAASRRLRKREGLQEWVCKGIGIVIV